MSFSHQGIRISWSDGIEHSGSFLFCYGIVFPVEFVSCFFLQFGWRDSHQGEISFTLISFKLLARQAFAQMCPLHQSLNLVNTSLTKDICIR